MYVERKKVIRIAEKVIVECYGDSSEYWYGVARYNSDESDDSKEDVGNGVEWKLWARVADPK